MAEKWAISMSPMAKWTDHRTAALETLRRKGKSRYWLAKQMADVMSATAVYGYLAKKYNVDYEKQHRISKILGIKFTDE